MEIDELRKHWENGCDYGKPDGPDDFVTECDCADENTWQE